MLLELRGVVKAFGSVRAVDGVDLGLEPGEAVGIIGPNGAGKTTLFNVVAGDLPPDTGKVCFKAQDITRVPPHRRCALGIARTYQIPKPFEKLTVCENLLVASVFGAGRSEREAAGVCAAILQQTGLATRANRLAGALTLLERKRLELARALATAPELLLLDEIAGGLTEAECRELVAVIRAIRAAGVTILWIEHIVHALLSVVERLIVLDFGRKVAEGEPRAVLQSRIVQQIYMGLVA
jgi:branched-chain amino acid transport system ATP-binding protein